MMYWRFSNRLYRRIDDVLAILESPLQENLSGLIPAGLRVEYFAFY